MRRRETQSKVDTHQAESDKISVRGSLEKGFRSTKSHSTFSARPPQSLSRSPAWNNKQNQNPVCIEKCNRRFHSGSLAIPPSPARVLHVNLPFKRSLPERWMETGKSRQENLMWENLNEYKSLLCFYGIFFPSFGSLSCFTAFCSNNTINKKKRKCRSEEREKLFMGKTNVSSFPSRLLFAFPLTSSKEIIKIKLRGRIDEWTKHMAGTLIISMALPGRKGNEKRLLLLSLSFSSLYYSSETSTWWRDGEEIAQFSTWRTLSQDSDFSLKCRLMQFWFVTQDRQLLKAKDIFS